MAKRIFTSIAIASAKGIDGLCSAAGALAALFIVGIVILVSAEVVSRGLFNTALLWSVEVIIVLVTLTGFVGLVYTEKRQRHITIDLLTSRFSPRTQAIWDIFVACFTLVVVVIVVIYGSRLAAESLRTGELLFGYARIPTAILRIGLCIGFILLGLQVVKGALSKAHILLTQPLERGKQIWDNPIILIVSFLAFVALSIGVLKLNIAAGVLCLMLGLILMGVPIFIGVALTGMTGLWLSFGSSYLMQSPIVMTHALGSVAFIALPLFIMVGIILERGGVAKELFDFADAWVGHFPGGLAISTIGACALFSALSGSSVATAATMAVVALPELIRHGYKPSFAVGTIAAGATLAFMIPPSGMMILYSAMTLESLGRLFIAGLLPGIILAILFTIYAIFYCSRTGEYEKRQACSLKERLSATRTAVWGLTVPVIILGGIYSGFFTATESGAIACVYALVMVLLRRKLTFAQLPSALREGALSTTMIFAIVLGAFVMGVLVSQSGVTQALIALIASQGTSPSLVVLFLMIMYAFLGCVLDLTSMTVITLPVVYPLIKSIGIDGVWFAVLFIVNVELAMLTPPIGINLFVLRGVSGLPFGSVVRGVVPFFFILLVGMLIVFLFPQLSLFIPNMLFGR